MIGISTLPQFATPVTLAHQEADMASQQEIKKARAAYLETLQARKRELADELRDIDAMINGVKMQTAGAALVPRTRGIRHGVSIKEQIAVMLKERGAPMHAADIADALRLQGVTLSEKDPKAVVVTAARRLVKDARAEQTGPNTFAAV